MGPKSTRIILMGYSEAVDCINRKTLWGTLYKEGLPITAIKNIAQGRQGAKLRRQEAGASGELGRNNVVVFR